MSRRIIDTPFIRRCIEQDDLVRFYTSASWRWVRADVLVSDHYECQVCKAKGRYTRADHVHHVMHVRQHPELALSKSYIDPAGKRQRNLISVCKACHEEIHGHRQKERPKPITEERW